MSEDEAILMDCLALHQSGDKDEAYKMLGRWFDGEAQWKADALIEAFADQLSLKGHLLGDNCHGIPSSQVGAPHDTALKRLN